MNTPDRDIDRIIEAGSFTCSKKNTEIGVPRCLENQQKRLCQCPLGIRLLHKKDAIKHRFDFSKKPDASAISPEILKDYPEPEPPKRNSKSKYITINPNKVVFIPSAHSHPKGSSINVYPYDLVFYTFDSRILKAKQDKKPISINILRTDEKIQKRIKDATSSSNYLAIPINQLISSPYAKRRMDKNQSDIQLLADDIKEKGVLQPIIVRRRKLSGGGYEIISGERRFRAAVMAGLTDIPAKLIESSDTNARLVQLAENLLRKDLSPIERVDSIAYYLDSELIRDKEFSSAYSSLGSTYIERLKTTLTKLDSDRRNKTHYFTHNVVGKLESLFQRLPAPVNWRSFFVHDFPLLTTLDPDVKQLSVELNLPKTHTKELARIKQTSPPETYQLLKLSMSESGKKPTLSQIKALCSQAPKAPRLNSESKDNYPSSSGTTLKNISTCIVSQLRSIQEQINSIEPDKLYLDDYYEIHDVLDEIDRLRFESNRLKKILKRIHLKLVPAADEDS